MLNLNDILFVVLTCDTYISDRVESIKNSWGKTINVVYLTDSNTNEPNLIGYDTPKNYDGIQEKYYNFLLQYDFTKYKYFFFLDDDTFVNLKNLELLDLPDHNELFCIGRELHLNGDRTDKWGNDTGYPMFKLKNKGSELPLIYPSGGSGFILSKVSVIKIQEYLNSVKNDRPISGHSDVSIGFWMRNCGIKFISSNQFWWNTPENLITNIWEKFIDDGTFITFHYVNPELMKTYHEKYNN
jgi:hypothetical protein